jgi:3-keto-5-aminohexanoate cleavage enzyme
MTKPCIICVAITGSLPRKADNPAVPITVSEQVESTHEAFEAGATIVHAHVRNDDETPSSDPEKFARLLEGLRQHCPGLIIQFSTGGRSGAGMTPDLVDWLAAEMLAYGIKPEVECFDLSHIHQAAAMQSDGRLAAPAYVQFVMGVKNAMPADRDVFDYYIRTVERLLPGSEWCAAGIGPAQVILNEWSVSSGGHARTGLEDNVRLDRNTLAPSNAALVRRVVEICERNERTVATTAQARDLLGLPAT